MQTNNNKTIVPEWVKVLAFLWAFCGGLLVDNTAQAWVIYFSGVGAFAVLMWFAYGDKIRKELRNE